MLPTLDNDVVLGVQNLLELFDHTGDPGDAATAERLRGILNQIQPGPFIHVCSDTPEGEWMVPDGEVIPPELLGSGTPDATKFLRGDGAWAATPGSSGFPEELGFSVLDFGAVGDFTTDDTTAIQDTIDYAKNNRNAVVYFPGGNKDYKVTSSLEWPRGVQMVGGFGGKSGAWRMPQLKQFTSGAHLFELSASDNVYWTTAQNLYLVGPGAGTGSTILSTANLGVGANWDTFSGFENCQLSHADIGLHLETGPTNLFLRKLRLDNLTTAIKLEGYNTSMITLDWFEFDNGSAPGGELIDYYAIDHPGSFTTINLSNGRCEINGTINGLVTVRPDDTADGFLRLLFQHLWVQGSSASTKPYVNFTADKPLFADSTWINCGGGSTTFRDLYGGAVASIAANEFEQVTKVKDGVATRL